MTPPRWMLLAPVVVTLLLGPTAASAQTTCVPMTTCVENDQVHILREPYLSKTWMVLSMPSPPASDRIYLTNDNVLDQLQKAMRTYSSLDVAVPYDQLDMYSGDDTFQWGWVPQSELINDPNRRAGIPAAAMGWNTTDCWITTSIGKFAYDPSDGVRLMCWTGDWCNPPWCTTMICGDTTNLDYLSAAVHEYGHALGLGHSTTPDATMYSVMFAQDTTARALLGCETDMVIKAYHDDNAAATVTGFAVTRGDGITATWLAEQEAATDHYVLEHAPVWPGPFMPLAQVPLDGAGEYSVTVPAVASGVFRLTEVEADGDTLPLWTEPDIEPSGPAPQFVQQTINFDSTLATLLSELSWLESAATEPTQYYIYCPESLAGSFQVLADVHTRWEGVPTEVVTYESIGGPIGVKAHIASHLPDGGFILKVGDAWEGVDVFGMAWRNNPVYYQDNGFTMDPWLPQPQLNLSPLTYRQEMAPQPISLSHWTPFVATPWWVVDHDDDGLPDPGYYLGYAPVSNQSEAEIFVAKSIQQMCSTPNPPSNMMPPAVVMTYARDYGNNSGALVKQMSESLRAYVREVNPNLAMYGTTTTDDNPLSTIQRNAAMKARFDAGMSSCTFLSTVSQRYELGAYAHVDINLLGYYFDVNALAPNQILAFGILITCEAGFARTESEYGTPVAERLLFVPNRGFWGYFGPERGSLQGGNDRIGRIIHRRQYETLPGAMPPTVGELANETVREAAAFKPDSLLAISYLLVGDPRGRIPSPDYAVVDVRPTDPIGRPLTLWPNPTRGELTLSFSLAATASVELSVFDVRGRRVKTVARSTLPAGGQIVRWGGCDQRGQLLESGIYLVQLRVGERLSKQRFVLLH